MVRCPEPPLVAPADTAKEAVAVDLLSNSCRNIANAYVQPILPQEDWLDIITSGVLTPNSDLIGTKLLSPST